MKYIVGFFLLIHSFYGLEGKSSVSECLQYAIQRPLFSDGNEINAPLDEIVNTVRPILRSRLALMNYDRMFPILQFLEHYDNYKQFEPSISPIQAFKTFKFKPLIPGVKGGPCVSLTLDLYDHIPESLMPYIVAARLPGRFQQFGFPEFCHTAILIKFSDPFKRERGYVLLDPSFDLAEPIVLKEGGDPFFYDLGEKGIWKFSIVGDRIICDIESEESEKQKSNPGFFQMMYMTNALLNPIESSAMPMILADRRYSLLSRLENGEHIVHMNIEMNKNRIIWDKGTMKLDPISFEQILAGEWFFPDWFAQSLYIGESVLSMRISRILSRKNVLDALYYEYLSLIKETGDFSMTGALSINQLNAILNSLRPSE